MVEHSPLFLEDSGIIAYEYNDSLTPDNVLISPIGCLKRAFLIGVQHDGSPYLATDIDDPKEAIPLLRAALKDMIIRANHEERIHT